ncbi:hypothetical protein OROGR_023056 [Orobanche gracilis]
MARILVFKIRPSQEILKIRDVARILVFKIRPSQKILKIRDGTPLEAEEILTYKKSLRNGSVWHISSKLHVPSNVLQKKRVARILVFKIRPSQEILKIRDGTPLEKKRAARILVFKIRPSQKILKIRDGTPLEAEEILTYKKSLRNGSVWHFSSKLHVPSNVLQKKRVARILVFKIRPSQEILKIRDGTPLEKKRVARILVFKIRPSQEILKIRDGTPLEAEEILKYRKKPSKRNKRVARILVFKIRPSQEILKIRDVARILKKRVARILVFKIRSSQKILKIRDGTPLEAEEILTYKKSLRNGSVWHFSSKLHVPSNVLQKKRVARILVFKIRPSQKILKIRDGTPLEAEEILTYKKSLRNGSFWHFSSKLDVPSNVLKKNRVARILVFKIRPSQEILKIQDGTPLEAEEILKYRKKPSKRIVARILVFKIRPSQKILKIRDGTPLEAEEILTYKKSLRNGSVWHFSSKLHVPSNVLQNKRVARILVFKIRPSQEILKIRDGTPLEKKRVARILVFKIRPSQKILKIRDGTPLEAEEILTYKKSLRNGSVWHFSSKLHVPRNVLQKKRVARILVFKIRPSQEILKIRDGTPLEKKRVARILVFKIRPSQKILKIRDGTPLEAEKILTYKKSLRNGSFWHFSSKLDVPSNVLKKNRVARILVFKIRPSQEILKIRDGTPLENRVARILVFKIRSSQKILKIRDGTPLEAEEILTYKKSLRNGSVWHFSSKLHVPRNVLQKKRVARILVFKIRPSQEILKIRDGTPLEKKRVARILVFKIRPSQKILKIRDGTPLEAEEILTYKKSLRNGSFWHFSSKLDVPSNVLKKNRVARILVFKIRPSQEILKIRDDTPLEMSSQKILKIRDGTPLEAEEILTYKKSLRNGSVWHFSSKLHVPRNVLQKKRVARILVFKIRPSQEILKIRDEILKIRDGTPLEKKRVARILVFKIRSSQKILKIRDGTPLEAEEILTYKKSLRNGSVWHFSSKLHVPSNVLQKKRVARILVFKIRPSQKILKIRDGTPLEAEEILTYKKSLRNGSFWHFSSKLDVPSNVLKKNRVARILVFKIRPSQEILKIQDGTPLEKKRKKRVARILVFKIRPSQKILKIRDGTPLEAEEILTYKKSLRNGSVWHFSSKLHVPRNVLQKKRVARILVFKIRPSQEILKIRDGTPLEKKRVARILVFKIRPSQKILKIRDGTPLEAEKILTYKKSLRNGSFWHFSSKLDVPSNVLKKNRVARILVFKIRPSQEILKIRDGTPLERVARILVFKIRSSQKILKIRDGTPLEAEEILTYKKSLRNGSVWHFSSKLHVPRNVLQKKRVARILVFKIRPSQEILKIRDGTPLERVARILVFKIRPSQKILKIRDGTPLEAEEILTYKKSLRNGSFWHFSSKLDVPSNVLKKNRVARILVFKIRPSQEILKIRDDTPLEKKRVARILVFKIRSSQKILKIRDGTPLEAEEILTYKKSLRNGSLWHFSSKLHVPSNVLQKKRVARILVFKIRPSQEILKIRDVARILVFKIRPSQKILKIRDGTPLEAEEILTYKKSLRNGSVWHFSSKLHVPSNVLQKKRVAWILVFKIRPSQEILKIRDGTPLEKILKIRDVKKRVARILVFKIRPSQKILKIRDGTPLEAEEILTYKKSLRNGSFWHFSSKLDVPSNVLKKNRVARILVFKIRPSQEILKIRDDTPLEKKRVARILVFKIRSSQKILKIRDGTPLEAEEILTYKKSLRNGSVWHFSSKLHVPSNVLQKKRVARILVFKIRPSQEILKIRDGTPLEKKRVARILVFKIRPSQKILKIRDGTPLEAEEILTYKKSLRNGSVWHFSSKLHVPRNVLQKKRVARILVFKIRPSQEILKIRDGTPLEKKRVARILVFKIRPSQKILKIRDGTPLEAEKILTYKKSLRNGSFWHFSSKLDVPSNVLKKNRVARILVFKIRPSQEILKIRDGTPLEKNRVARILVFKIRSSQKILKIRDGTPLEAEEILTYKKSLRNGSVWHFSSKLHVPRNVLQKKRVARILVFKIRPSQEILKIRDGTPLERVARILVFKIRPSQKILKIRDGTPLEAEEILTYKKSLRNGSFWHFSSKLDVPSNVLKKNRVARILVFKIRPSQEILKIRDDTPLEKKRVARILVFKIRSSQKILKIRDGTPLEAEEILTYKKSLRNGSVWHFSSKLHVPSNVLQKKRVARILVFKIRPSQEILKIRDGTPLEKKRVARILVFKIRPSQKILKIRDGTPLEAEEILTYKKSLRNGSFWHFSSKLDVPSNVLKKNRVARILVFKIRPSQEILKIRDDTPLEKKRVARILVFKIRSSQKILKIRDGTPLEAEEILTYKKSLRNGSVWHFSSKLHVPSNVLQKKRVARILVFKIRPSQEILKIRDGTPLEKKRVARILVFKIRPSQKILKIRDGTPLEAEEILTYKKSLRNGSVWHFSSKLHVPRNVLQKKRVARILVFKIRPSQEILKIRDGTPLEKKRVARILVFKIRPSQKILKIRDGTPLEAEKILTYKKSLRNGSFWHFSSKLDVPSNVLKKNRVARILVFKIRPSQEILKIRDGTPLEAEEILKYRKKPSKRIVARILVFKIRSSQKILKIRDGTPLEAEEILTYKKSLRNGSVWHFSSKLHVPRNVLQKKRVARILVFKIRPSQEILKIRDGTPLEKKRVARILVFKIRPSQKILKIRDGTPLEAEEILTYKKSLRNGSFWHFSSKLDVPSNVLKKNRVARILVFKIRPSQEILKIRDDTPLEAEEILKYRKKPSKRIVARILVFKIRSSQKILKIRDGTPLEAEEILTYKKSLRNGSVWHFSSKLHVPSNVLQKKRVARILVFKIRPSQEILKIRDGTPLEKKRVARILVFKIRPSQKILKIRDGTPLEAEEILTYKKSLRNGSVWHFSSKLHVPSNVLQKKRVAWILVFKIRPSQEILKIRDGTPLEWPSQEILKIRDVARILVFKIRPSQKILKIRDGTPLEAEEILTYKKSLRNGSFWHFYSKLDVPSNVLKKNRVARILVFKIRPSQEILKIRDDTPLEKKRVARILVFKIRSSQKILKIRDGTPLEAEEILTYKKSLRNGSVWHFSSKLHVPSNVLQKKRVARILVFKIRPSQEILKIRDVARILVFKIRPSQKILKIRDGTPLETEEILTYKKSLRNGSVWHFSSKLHVPSNVLQKKRVAWILVFKIRPSQEILKIRDGTPLEKKRVARILVFKIRPSQEILKIRDGTPLEAEEILKYRKKPSKRKKRVARILVFKIRPSQKILKIRDGTPLEAEEILTYKKSLRNGSVWHFSSKLHVPSNVLQKKRVTWILVFKIRPSQEILKIRDGTPLE